MKFGMTFSKNTYTRRTFINKGSLLFASIAMPRLGVPSVFESTSKTNKNTFVPTLTGEISCNKLGTTLMHEHILWFGGPRLEDAGYTPIPDDLKSETVDFAVSLLNDAARVGIDTVVDLTPFRPVDLYKRIAERTTVTIVASTGFYRRAKIPKRLAEIEDEKQMEELMLKEITEGMDNTKIKAGIIKVAGEGGSLSDW